MSNTFGIILWEFWSIDPPYKDIVAKDVANNVKKDRNYRPKVPLDMPKEISDLMQKCWDYDPAKRPTYLEIINYIDTRNIDPADIRRTVEHLSWKYQMGKVITEI